jgi:hypothetical protein
MKNDQFNVKLVNQVKLANSVVGNHGIGQFQEMANLVQQVQITTKLGRKVQLTLRAKSQKT